MLCFCDVFASGPLNFEWLAEFRVRPNAAYLGYSNISGVILISSGLMPMRLFLTIKPDTRSRVLLEFILPLAINRSAIPYGWQRFLFGAQTSEWHVNRATTHMW
jgi:hypothetical protein